MKNQNLPIQNQLILWQIQNDEPTDEPTGDDEPTGNDDPDNTENLDPEDNGDGEDDEPVDENPVDGE